MQTREVFTEPTFQIRFLSDPMGKFTEAMDLGFDAATAFGNRRSKRYALLIEDGKVKEVFVEPDNTGVNGKAYELRIKFPCSCYRFVYSLTFILT